MPTQADINNTDADFAYIAAIATGAADAPNGGNPPGTATNRVGATSRNIARVLRDIGATPYPSWAALALVTPLSGTWAQVLTADNGTHGSVAGDLGANGGQTPNGGFYRGDGNSWIRIGVNQSDLAAQYAAAAVAAVAGVPASLTESVRLTARAAISNLRSKVQLENLIPGLIDTAGNYQNANDWRRFVATVTPGGVVTSNFNFPANSAVLFKRGDGSLVGAPVVGTGSIPNGGDIVAGYQIPVPAGAVFVEACAPTYRFISDGSNDQLLFPHVVMLEGTVALPGLWSDYLLFDPTKTAREKQWIGRKVGVLADSFWSGRRWYEELQAQLGIELVNFSQGGRTMAGALKDANGNPLTQASVAGLDALIYALHTNSAAANVPVGDPGDTPSIFDASGNATTGTTAFSQAVGALNTLVGWNKDMLLMIGSPIYRPGVDLIPDYQAAMPTLAQMFAGAVVEPDLKCGVNAVNAAERLQDEVHPTETGFQTWYRSVFYDTFLRNSPLN